jgi:hypothetical protein
MSSARPVPCWPILDRNIAMIAVPSAHGTAIVDAAIAARSRAPAACAQAAFKRFRRSSMEHTAARAMPVLVGGMSLGQADPAAHARRRASGREPLSRCTRSLGRP